MCSQRVDDNPFHLHTLREAALNGIAAAHALRNSLHFGLIEKVTALLPKRETTLPRVCHPG